MNNEQFDKFLDGALKRHANAPQDIEASVARVMTRLASPLPRQKAPFWRLPAVLLNWQFAPAWPRMAALGACDSLLERADQGLDTLIGEGGVKVSGGEKQRLSIARALLRRPHLLVFDEATSYIDTETEIKIQDAMEKLMSGRTSVIVAHRLSTVRHADRIIVLNRGRIVETGSHEELMNRRGFYYRLHQVQG